MSSIEIKASSSSSSSQDIVATTTDGCVKCEGSVKCPVCAENEYCVMTSLTCKTCPYTYCATKNNSTISGLLNNSTIVNTTNSSITNNVNGMNSSSHQGSSTHMIEGAVIGSVLGTIVIILIVWYSFYLRKRKMLTRVNAMNGGDKNYNFNDIDDDDLEMDDLEDDDDIEEGEDLYDSEDDVRNDGSRTKMSRPVANMQSHQTMTLSQQAQYINELRSMSHPSRRTTNQNNNNNALSVVGDRSSTASTVRTGASNILPIGYIPGVTSASNTNNKNNHLNIVGDIRSHITLSSSILDGGYDDEEEESEQGSKHSEQVRLSRERRNNNKSKEYLTTAIKGKPKLVQINEDEEGEEEQYKRDSMVSVGTGTGSYILDFDISSPPSRPHPPIPAAGRGNSTRYSTLLSTTSAQNKGKNGDEDMSTMISDMITIDTQAIGKDTRNDDPFGDSHKIE